MTPAELEARFPISPTSIVKVMHLGHQHFELKAYDVVGRKIEHVQIKHRAAVESLARGLANAHYLQYDGILY